MYNCGDDLFYSSIRSLKKYSKCGPKIKINKPPFPTFQRYDPDPMK